MSDLGECVDTGKDKTIGFIDRQGIGECINTDPTNIKIHNINYEPVSVEVRNKTIDCEVNTIEANVTINEVLLNVVVEDKKIDIEINNPNLNVES